MLRCRVFGHRYRFSAEANTMSWRCGRCAGAAGSKQYRTAADASRYAHALDREDSEDTGRRAPLIGLLPLRLYRLARRSQLEAGAPNATIRQRHLHEK